MEVIAYWFNIINIDSDNDLALNKWGGIIWISSYWLYSPVKYLAPCCDHLVSIMAFMDNRVPRLMHIWTNSL